MSACFCIGPQNGQPLCPCAMRGVTIRDGRYVREEDLGPVRGHSDEIDIALWEAKAGLHPAPDDPKMEPEA